MFVNPYCWQILRMEDRHRDKLRSNRVALIKDLIVNEDLLAQMEQNDIFTPSMVEEIEVYFKELSWMSRMRA